VLNDQQQIIRLLMMIAAFGLVLSLWLACVVLWWSRKAKRNKLVTDRLRAIETHGSVATGENRTLRLWHEGQEATISVPGMSGPRGITAWLEDIRAKTGWKTPASSMILGVLGMAAGVAAAAYLISRGNLFVTIISPFAMVLILWIYVSNFIDKRMAHFETSLIDALELAARSLRAGHPLLGSFQLIADEVPGQVGDTFGRICQQQQLGVAMEDALRGVADEAHSDDMKLFATSVMIQVRSGGNLADMMVRLANVIRERARLSRRVRVLTAQTQLSKRVLLAMPFLIFVLLNLINPKYMKPLYTTETGTYIMFAAAIGMFIGWMLMNWLSRLKQ
jgi:tight adherence protein B